MEGRLLSMNIDLTKSNGEINPLPKLYKPEIENSEIIIRLSERLKLLRRSYGLTQNEVSSILSLDRSTYAYYEAERARPSLETLVRVAKFYRVSLEFLLGVDNK